MTLIWIKRTAQVDNDYIAMITAANTPHTITNALMICFSSETDIRQTDLARSPTTPVIGVAGVVALMRVRCVRGGGETHRKRIERHKT
jgi:hypothetical protein